MDTTARFLPAAFLPLALLFASVQQALASGPAGVDAAAGTTCLPRIEDGWLRAPPMPMPMMAGFARVVNPCAGEVVVTGARSEAFAAVELHETRVVDGVSRMRALDTLPVAAGGEAVLRPGGLHLMLMRSASPLAEGDVARVELVLADGRSISADFPVRAPGAR